MLTRSLRITPRRPAGPSTRWPITNIRSTSRAISPPCWTASQRSNGSRAVRRMRWPRGSWPSSGWPRRWMRGTCRKVSGATLRRCWAMSQSMDNTRPSASKWMRCCAFIWRVTASTARAAAGSGLSRAWRFDGVAAGDYDSRSAIRRGAEFTIQRSNWQRNGHTRDWIREDQMSQLYARIVELERRKAQDKPGETNWSLEQARVTGSPRCSTRRSSPRRARSWRAFPMREANYCTVAWRESAPGRGGRPPAAVGGALWKKQLPAPCIERPQSAVQALSEPSRRIVMRFVYERALDARELTAPNFLGLRPSISMKATCRSGCPAQAFDADQRQSLRRC
jgi:hypothetical protein